MMPASLAPISAELFADFRGGKESALEQIFRANFDAFTTDANQRLADAAGAQKVVAGAWLEVWDRRDKVADAAALADLLHKAVDGGVAHELRRRSAAHHMAGAHKEAHDALPPAAVESTDQWWAKIVGVLHTAKSDPNEIAKQRLEHSRHEAARHMKKVARPKRTGTYVIIGLLVLAASAVPLWYFNKGAATTKAGQLLGRDDAKVLRSKDGQRGAVTLEDSVAVRIGSATTVRYPSHYPLDARALFVAGAAAIKVPANVTLLVKANDLWLTASGAEFVVRNFPDDSGAVMLKVLGGTLSVNAGKEIKELATGSTTLVLSNGAFMELQADRAAMAFGWLDGKFASEHLPLRRVLLEMKKWYGLDITTKDSSFLERPVQMTATLDTAKVAIAALEEGASVTVKLISEGKASMTDAAGLPKPKAKGKK
jgi:hypothetical protein